MKNTWFVLLLAYTAAWGAESVSAPILLYHRLGSVIADSMTVRTFASDLAYLKAQGYSVIPLRNLTDFIAGKAHSLPERSVVITADDGHKSIYTEMYPLLKRDHIPVTLFIYPSAISNASYAMTWQQLREMQDSGLVDIQSHSYWHPNFKKEKKRLSADAYQSLVQIQLYKSKQVLQQRLDKPVDMLAWPYGIFDENLMENAKKQGYSAAFTLEARPAGRSDKLMALPRFLMTNQKHALENLLAEVSRPHLKPKESP